jgi:predicted nucleotidyltransferase
MVLRETSRTDSSVQEVVDLVTDTLAAKKVKFLLTGGLLLNSYGVGRPTYDVDLIVARSEWQKAVTALEGLSVNYERMGAPGEQEPAARRKTRD